MRLVGDHGDGKIDPRVRVAVEEQSLKRNLVAELRQEQIFRESNDESKGALARRRERPSRGIERAAESAVRSDGSNRQRRREKRECQIFPNGRQFDYAALILNCQMAQAGTLRTMRPQKSR